MGRIASLATIALLAAAAIPIEPSGAEQRPRCRIKVEVGEGSTQTVFKARCNFAIGSLRLESSAPVVDFRRQLDVTRRADPEDRFRCRRSGSSKLACSGRAGKGARIVGSFRTPQPACSARTWTLAKGAWECDEEFCPSVQPFVLVPPRPPADC